MREWLNQNPAMAGLVIAGVLVVAIVIMVLSGSRSDRETDRVFYYDVNAGEIFTAPNTGSPIRAPSDAADAEAFSGYMAAVMGCGSCREEDRFAAYLMRNGQIRAVEGGPWVDAETDPRAIEITQREAAARCVDAPPRRCYPR